MHDISYSVIFMENVDVFAILNNDLSKPKHMMVTSDCLKRCKFKQRWWR
jgi:tRNA pseudouridine-54 N-methylase